jgi:hypothetical protein
VLLKCIDNENVETELTKGQLYELLTQNKKFFRVISDNRTEGGYFKERFTPVEQASEPPKLSTAIYGELCMITDPEHIIRATDYINLKENGPQLWSVENGWIKAQANQIGAKIKHVGIFNIACKKEDLPVTQAKPQEIKIASDFVLEKDKTYLTACGIAVKMQQISQAHLPFIDIMGERVYYNLDGTVNTYISSLTQEQIAKFHIVEALDEDIPQPPAGYKLKDGGAYGCPKQYDHYLAKPHGLSVACCSLENKSDRYFLLTPNPPASVAKINDVVAKLGSVPVGGGVNCPKEIKMVDKHVDCPGSELKSYNSDATVRKFVARGATYWLLEPAKTFGMIAVRSVRYIAFAGLLGGSGYVAYDPSAAMTAIKSCVPHVTIEAPSIMGEK